MAFPDPEIENPYEDGNGRLWFHDGKRWGPVTSVTAGGGGEVATFLDKNNAGSAITITVTDAKYQQVTLNQPSCTITIAGTPPAGEVNECVVRLVHDGTTSARAVTWAGVDAWPNDTAPFTPQTDSGARSYVTFITLPDGTCEGFHGGNFY